MLKVSNLRFGYVPTVDIFHDVSLTIEAGEFIAIGGRNGCGKTTLTRLLVGLERPTEGTIMYEGVDITAMPASARGRFIGYVFQQPDRQMFRNTVAAEVAYGPETLGFSKEKVAKMVDDALARTGISHLKDAYPPTLRRGEKQRVAIASALAMESKILILDEPTSGQDGKETKDLLALLADLHEQGLTILLITHDMEIMASACTRAIIMGNGTKAFDGTPEELFTTCDHLHELGLTKPPCVELAETIPGLGYCKSMEDFQKRLIAYLEQHHIPRGVYGEEKGSAVEMVKNDGVMDNHLRTTESVEE